MSRQSTPRPAFCFGDDYIVPSPPQPANREDGKVREVVFDARFEGLANSVNGGSRAQPEVQGSSLSEDPCTTDQ